MRILYDKDIDYVEVIFEKAENYAEEISDNVEAFKTEDDDRVVGYAFENASASVFNSEILKASEKLAIHLKMIRKNLDWTQEKMAEKLGKELREYQRIESRESQKGIPVDDFDDIQKRLTGLDAGKVFSKRVG